MNRTRNAFILLLLNLEVRKVCTDDAKGELILTCFFPINMKEVDIFAICGLEVIFKCSNNLSEFELWMYVPFKAYDAKYGCAHV